MIEKKRSCFRRNVFLYCILFDQNNRIISLYITNTISAINAANPIKCTIPSFSGAIRFLLTASIRRNTDALHPVLGLEAGS